MGGRGIGSGVLPEIGCRKSEGKVAAGGSCPGKLSHRLEKGRLLMAELRAPEP